MLTNNKNEPERSVWFYKIIYFYKLQFIYFFRYFFTRCQHWLFADPWMSTQAQMWPMCRACLLSPRLRYACGIDAREYGMVHVLRVQKKQKCQTPSGTITVCVRHQPQQHGSCCCHTYLTPCDQICLFKRVSMRTSAVPICLVANFLISEMALGPRRLKPLKIEQGSKD